jgi:hypothetical protein
MEAKMERDSERFPCPHTCPEYEPSCMAIVSQGTVSADKIASCIHGNARETCLTIDEENPVHHAA